MAVYALVIIFLFAPIGSLSAQTLKTVRMMTPTIGVNVLVYEAANRFGFYRQEGFTIAAHPRAVGHVDSGAS